MSVPQRSTKPAQSGFYGLDGDGQRLAEAAHYPPSIRRFLDEEARLARARLADYDVLVEVGCMWGRNADLALRSGKRYVGIDIVESYVDAANRDFRTRRLDERASAVLLDAADLPALVGSGHVGESERCLVFLPFNSFGNMADPVAVMSALAAFGSDFLISTYGTDADATGERERYYRMCAYAGIEVRSGPSGVRFVAPSGLDTIAYHPAEMRKMGEEAGLSIRGERFAGIGVLFSGRPAGAPAAPNGGRRHGAG